MSLPLDGNYLICPRPSNAALDGTAGLVRLIARPHFQGRDGELAELIEGRSNYNCDVSRAVQTIKGQIDSGKGVGERTIINIMCNRRRLAGDAEADTDDKRGLVAIREAMASLIAHGRRKAALHVREDRFEFPTDLVQP